MNQSLLLCQDLTICRSDQIILTDINLSVGNGEVVILLGSNGSGKSSLIKTIAGILPLQKGQILINNKELKTINHKDLSKIISYAAQNNDFDLSINVFDFVALGRYPHQGIFPRFSPTDRQKVNEALQITNLISLADKQISKISGGEQQRALIARSIATDAPLMLLDEPSASLDIKHQLDLFKLIGGLRSLGKGIIIALHDINDAIKLGDKIILINNGKIIYSGQANDSSFIQKLEETYQLKVVQKPKFDFELRI